MLPCILGMILGSSGPCRHAWLYDESIPPASLKPLRPIAFGVYCYRLGPWGRVRTYLRQNWSLAWVFKELYTNAVTLWTNYVQEDRDGLPYTTIACCGTYSNVGIMVIWQSQDQHSITNLLGSPNGATFVPGRDPRLVKLAWLPLFDCAASRRQP